VPKLKLWRTEFMRSLQCFSILPEGSSFFSITWFYSYSSLTLYLLRYNLYSFTLYSFTQVYFIYFYSILILYSIFTQVYFIYFYSILILNSIFTQVYFIYFYSILILYSIFTQVKSLHLDILNSVFIRPTCTPDLMNSKE